MNRVNDDTLDNKNTLPGEEGKPETAKQDLQLNGAFWHSIDAKGRVIIPQFFREQLKDGIIVSVNTAQDSIAIYPTEIWKERVDMLSRLVKKKRTLEPVLSRFSMLSYPNCSFDQQGRVLIPALLREMYLKETQSVRVSGAFDHIRIVSQEQAEEEDKRFGAHNIDILEMISDIQQEE
ncbi:MAG: division/cell wall cluster transcriptional repressor MraZ [Christensenellales bacterium]